MTTAPDAAQAIKERRYRQVLKMRPCIPCGKRTNRAWAIQRVAGTWDFGWSYQHQCPKCKTENEKTMPVPVLPE